MSDAAMRGENQPDTIALMARRSKVQIENRADGGVLFWLGKLYLFFAACLVVVAGLAAVITYGYFASQVPPTPNLSRFAEVVPAVSRMYAKDGTLLGEFADEWREIVPYDQIPEGLVDAFLAAEDHAFFEHHGLYFKGILRAAWANFVAGDFAQGGSTITQQLAKQFLTPKASLKRKIKEAILTRRLEARYSKEAILSAYLNIIYLGSGAFGIKAAARRYFSKDLDELNTAEMATLAGLAQAPSSYSPLGHPALARERRNAILKRMARYGFISEADARTWQAHPLTVNPYGEVFGDRDPYFAEHVRRYVIDRYGEDALMTGGLRIETTVSPTVDRAAYETVVYGARKQDKRQGWRGAVAYLDPAAREIFRKRVAEHYGEKPLTPGRRYLALVEKVGARGARVLIGTKSYELPLSNMAWAATWSRVDAENDHTITDARAALRVGDVVWARAETEARGEFEEWFLAGPNPRWRPPVNEQQAARRRAREADDLPDVVLEQVPHPQAAIFTADHKTGYIVAMVGGTDFSRSQYNRTKQACRQPGSTFKPIYYSAGLNAGFGFDTLLNDIPRAEVDPVTGEVWMPGNFDDTVQNKVTLEYALVFSKNVPSIDLFKRLGADDVETWARRLGFSTEIIADKALALGASCTYLDELTRAFAIIARNGRWVQWVPVRRILDRNGAIIEDNTVYYDPMLAPADRLDRIYARAGTRAPQAIPARAAFLTSKLLRQEVRHGFASIIRRTGIIAAGKTGTSSATMDTSFVGYTSRWITSVWMGDDLRIRPLGRDDAAFKVVVPMWAKFMAEVAAGHPREEIPWTVPEGVSRRDRGGDRGEQAEEPMRLIYRRAAHPEDLPADARFGAQQG